MSNYGKEEQRQCRYETDEFDEFENDGFEQPYRKSNTQMQTGAEYDSADAHHAQYPANGAVHISTKNINRSHSQQTQTGAEDPVFDEPPPSDDGGSEISAGDNPFGSESENADPFEQYIAGDEPAVRRTTAPCQRNVYPRDPFDDSSIELLPATPQAEAALRIARAATRKVYELDAFGQPIGMPEQPTPAPASDRPSTASLSKTGRRKLRKANQRVRRDLSWATEKVESSWPGYERIDPRFTAAPPHTKIPTCELELEQEYRVVIDDVQSKNDYTVRLEELDATWWDMQETMQVVYTYHNKISHMLCKSGALKPGLFCVAANSSTYVESLRAYVERVDLIKRIAEVTLVDKGAREIFPISNLVELEQRFVDHPISAFRVTDPTLEHEFAFRDIAIMRVKRILPYCMEVELRREDKSQRPSVLAEKKAADEANEKDRRNEPDATSTDEQLQPRKEIVESDGGNPHDADDDDAAQNDDVGLPETVDSREEVADGSYASACASSAAQVRPFGPDQRGRSARPQQNPTRGRSTPRARSQTNHLRRSGLDAVVNHQPGMADFSALPEYAPNQYGSSRPNQYNPAAAGQNMPGGSQRRQVEIIPSNSMRGGAPIGMGRSLNAHCAPLGPFGVPLFVDDDVGPRHQPHLIEMDDFCGGFDSFLGLRDQPGPSGHNNPAANNQPQQRQRVQGPTRPRVSAPPRPSGPLSSYGPRQVAEDNDFPSVMGAFAGRQVDARSQFDPRNYDDADRDRRGGPRYGDPVYDGNQNVMGGRYGPTGMYDRDYGYYQREPIREPSLINDRSNRFLDVPREDFGPRNQCDNRPHNVGQAPGRFGAEMTYEEEMAFFYHPVGAPINDNRPRGFPAHSRFG